MSNKCQCNNQGLCYVCKEKETLNVQSLETQLAAAEQKIEAAIDILNHADTETLMECQRPIEPKDPLRGYKARCSECAACKLQRIVDILLQSPAPHECPGCKEKASEVDAYKFMLSEVVVQLDKTMMKLYGSIIMPTCEEHGVLIDLRTYVNNVLQV